MKQNKKQGYFTRYVIGILLLLIAVNAFGGGIYGMAGAEKIPLEWLNGSPFDNYFIPALILFVCVGGSSFFAAIAVLKRHRSARWSAFASSIIILCWIGAQVAVIGYVSWMQPAIAIIGLLIFLLCFQLPRYDR